MVKIENRSGCCKYCKRVDTCILSAIGPLVKAMGHDDPVLSGDVYAAVEEVMHRYDMDCTAPEDSCPFCKKHADSGCYGDD